MKEWKGAIIWTEAIEHGRAQGIPETELDFATD
jgi:hypothetical protein